MSQSSYNRGGKLDLPSGDKTGPVILTDDQIDELIRKKIDPTWSVRMSEIRRFPNRYRVYITAPRSADQFERDIEALERVVQTKGYPGFCGWKASQLAGYKTAVGNHVAEYEAISQSNGPALGKSQAFSDAEAKTYYAVNATIGKPRKLKEMIEMVKKSKGEEFDPLSRRNSDNSGSYHSALTSPALSPTATTSASRRGSTQSAAATESGEGNVFSNFAKWITGGGNCGPSRKTKIRATEESTQTVAGLLKVYLRYHAYRKSTARKEKEVKVHGPVDQAHHWGQLASELGHNPMRTMTAPAPRHRRLLSNASTSSSFSSCSAGPADPNGIEEIEDACLTASLGADLEAAQVEKVVAGLRELAKAQAKLPEHEREWQPEGVLEMVETLESALWVYRGNTA